MSAVNEDQANLPQPDLFWKVELRARGDPSPDAIYLAVGRALSAWEGRTEFGLSTLFAALSESASAAPARAYGLITSAITRQQMLEDSLNVFFGSRPGHQQLHDQLKRVLKHYGQAASRRNEIAHGTVMGTGDGETSHFFLVPPMHNTKKKLQTPNLNDRFGALQGKYRFVSEDVDVLERKFIWLADVNAQLYRDIFPLAYPERAQQLKESGWPI